MSVFSTDSFPAAVDTFFDDNYWQKDLHLELPMATETVNVFCECENCYTSISLVEYEDNHLCKTCQLHLPPNLTAESTETKVNY